MALSIAFFITPEKDTDIDDIVQERERVADVPSVHYILSYQS